MQQIETLDRRVLLGGAVVRSGRRQRRLLHGRADLRSGEPSHTRHPTHRARRSRRQDRRDLVRRAAPPRRGLQQHGRRSPASARRARTHASTRGVGRDGAPGGARDQESAHADPAQCRASSPRARRSRRAARPGPAGVRRDDPHAGQAAAADLVGVLQLRLVANGQAVGGRRHGARFAKCSTRTARDSKVASISTWSCPTTLPHVSVDRTLVSRALVNIVENALHAMPGSGALTVRAGRNGRSVVHSCHGHRCRHGCRGAGPRLRALLLDESGRHRTRPADRQAERRIERRDDRRCRASATRARPWRSRSPFA